MTRFAIALLLSVFVYALMPVAGAEPARCGPAGSDIRFVCDQTGPEDLAVVPGGQWVISPTMQGDGAIRLNSVRDNTTIALFPSASAKVRPDTTTYKSCPGPLDAAAQKVMKTHGIYLRPGSGS